MELTFRPVPLQSEPAVSLVNAMRAEMSALYDELDIDAPDMPKAGPGELGPPGGTFLAGFDAGDRPICCGGLKRLSDQACEIKRMYVIPRARGRGVGRLLLAALEQAAVELGYSVIRLDTGPRQPEAERMYRSAGYSPIGNFNANPMASFFGEKQLASSAANE
jgi:GNAT superfamily N-acetyltransferase